MPQDGTGEDTLRLLEIKDGMPYLKLPQTNNPVGKAVT